MPRKWFAMSRGQDMQQMRKRQRGRPSKDEKDADVVDAFQLLMMRVEGRSASLTFKDVARDLRMTDARARAVATRLIDFVTRIRSGPAGLKLVDDSASYYWSKINENTMLKEAIAAEAVKLVPPSSTIACSPGTTVARTVARILEMHPYMSVITNSFGVLDHIPHVHHSTIQFVGGTYDPATHSCLGDEALESLTGTAEAGRTGPTWSHAIIGVSGIDLGGNLFVKHREEVKILKALATKTTDEVLIVASVEKLAQSDTWSFTTIEQLSTGSRSVKIITNPIEDMPPRSANSNDTDHRINTATEVMKKFQGNMIFAKAEEEIRRSRTETENWLVDRID